MIISRNKLLHHHRLVIILLAVYYAVGVAGMVWIESKPLFIRLIPLSLMLSIITLAFFHEKYTWRFVIAILAIYAFGYFVEVLGVNTGLIFGRYHYGASLGLKVMGTPLIIGVNWAILIYSSVVLAEQLRVPPLARIFIAPLLMVSYDVFLEPVAVRSDMWWWETSQIPLQNYLAWFIVSLILTYWLRLNVNSIKNKIAPALFIIQFAFFMILNILYYMF